MQSNRLILAIRKRWIASHNIEEALEAISFLITDSAIIKRFAGQLELSFREWEDACEDEWDMGAVSHWIYKLTIAFPYWFVFLNRAAPSNVWAMNMLTEDSRRSAKSNKKPDDQSRFLRKENLVTMLYEKQIALYKKWAVPLCYRQQWFSDIKAA